MRTGFFSVLGKFPPGQFPHSEFLPIKFTLILTQTLTLTQVGIHWGRIDHGGMFRTPIFSIKQLNLSYQATIVE